MGEVLGVHAQTKFHVWIEVSALSNLYLHVSDHDSDVHKYLIIGGTQGQLPKFILASKQAQARQVDK